MRLPHISRLDAGVYSAGVTSLKDNALLEFCGDEAAGLPFLRPLLELEGDPLALADLHWERLDGWLPRFHCQVAGLEISGTIFAPLDEKGFVYLLEVSSAQDCQIELGLEGWWKSLDLVVFSARPLEARWQVWQDSWTGSLVGEAGRGLPNPGLGYAARPGGPAYAAGRALPLGQPFRSEGRRDCPGGVLRLAQPGAGWGAHRRLALAPDGLAAPAGRDTPVVVFA